MQLWIWNEFRFPKITKWLVFEHVCSFVQRVFWRSSKDSLESSRHILGVLGVYGAKHSPSFSCFGGPSGWFWGFSRKGNSFFRKPLIFAIWASVANWDEDVCLKSVLKWCKYEFGMIFASQRLWNDLSLSMSAGSSGGCSGGLPKILWSVRAISLVSEEYMVRSTLLRPLVLGALRTDFWVSPKYTILSFQNIRFSQSKLVIWAELKSCV